MLACLLLWCSGGHAEQLDVKDLAWELLLLYLRTTFSANVI